MNMKILLPAMAFLLLGAAGLRAQDMSNIAERSASATSAPVTAHDVTGFSAPTYAPGPGISPNAMKTPANPHPDLKPRLGGVFVDGVKYGTVMISPTAPLTLGMGEKYLSAPSQTQDLQHESGTAAHRDSGGLKLFSLEF